MSCFTEKELMTEVLTNEKALSGLYHHATLEASTENIFKELDKLKCNAIKKQHETFKIMEQNNMYQIEQIQQTEIEKTKTKLSQAVAPNQNN